MEKRKVKRMFGALTPAQKRRLTIVRKQIAEELPELMRRNQMMIDAEKEQSFSGQLRRAIAASKWDVFEISKKVNVTIHLLVDFMAGVKPLETDVVDRLTKLLKYRLNPQTRTRKTG